MRPSLSTLLAASLLITGCTTPRTSESPIPTPSYRGLLAADQPVLGALYGLRVYVVTRGDTLGKIAHRTGVPIKELRRLNPELDPTRMRIGQQIRISEERIE